MRTESEGDWSSFGYHERHDVQAILSLVRNRWPHDPCAALGLSMGAAALCFAGASAHGFDAFVLESLYHDLERAFQNRLGTRFPPWFRYFRHGIMWLTEQRLGVRIAELAPVAHIAQLTPRPILLLAGSDDSHAPPEDVAAIARQAAPHAQVTVIERAGHEDLLETGGNAYAQVVLSFLERHLLPAHQSHTCAA